VYNKGIWKIVNSVIVRQTAKTAISSIHLITMKIPTTAHLSMMDFSVLITPMSTAARLRMNLSTVMTAKECSGQKNAKIVLIPIF